VKALFGLGFQPLVLAQLRIAWAFAFLLISLSVARRSLLRIRVAELPGVLIFGTLGVAGVQLAYYLAIARLNIAIALLVQYLGLVAITAWERYRRQQEVPLNVWGALALVLVGAFFAVGAYQPSLLKLNLPGIGFGLVAAALLAFYMLRASALLTRLNTWTILVYSFGAGTLMWLAYDLVSRPSLPTQLWIFIAMAMVGLFGTLLAHGLFVLALRTIRPSRAGIVATAEPVIAGLIAFLIFKDGLQPLQLLGAAVVVSGIVLVQIGGEGAVAPTPAYQ
jgi:drug/metabolite transporter (DMT)-like permease